MSNKSVWNPCFMMYDLHRKEFDKNKLNLLWKSTPHKGFVTLNIFSTICFLKPESEELSWSLVGSVYQWGSLNCPWISLYFPFLQLENGTNANIIYNKHEQFILEMNLIDYIFILLPKSFHWSLIMGLCLCEKV